MKISLTAIGDSQTTIFNAYCVRGYMTWPAQLVRLIRKNDLIDMRARIFGTGGERTDQFLARADVITYYDTPAVCFIHGGTNDKAQSVADATIQANIQALVKAAKFGVKGTGGVGVTVAGQANLPSTNAEVGQRYVVLSDTSTTGGVAAYTSGQAATITGSSAGQTVWECRYPGQAGERGWGRIATAATAPTHCNRIVVVGRLYDNFTTGGDTPTVQNTNNAAVRADQQAAVAAENVTVNGRASVVYADMYAALAARITAGSDPDFSSVAYDATKSWHQIQNDQHYNTYGHALEAQYIRAAMPAAWITEMQALAPLAAS